MKPIKIIVLFCCFQMSVSFVFAQLPTILQFKNSNIKSPIKQTQTKMQLESSTVSNQLARDTLRGNLLPYVGILNVVVKKNQQPTQNKLIDSARSFLNKTLEAKLERELNVLKDSVKNIANVHDTLLIKKLYAKIDAIKVYNTDEFLTTLKPSKPFVISKIGRYNIDSLNKYLYNQSNVSTFQSAAIQDFTGSSTFVSTELASFLFGPVRMGIVGTFLTKGDTAKDSAIKNNIQKIVSNGGSINFNFSLPLFFARNKNEQTHFGIFAQMNNGINPGIDSTGTTNFSKNVSFVNQTGILFHFDVGSNDSKALLSFDLPCYYVSGSNNTLSQLGLPNFSVIKLQVGAIISNLFNIHVSGPIWSSSKIIQNTPFAVSLQFSPAQTLKSSSN